MADGPEAPRRGGGTPRRHGAKGPGGARRTGGKAVRAQLRLGERTVERLAVHAALTHRSQSAIAEEILDGWLTRFGKGRELFSEDAAASEPGTDQEDVAA